MNDHAVVELSSQKPKLIKWVGADSVSTGHATHLLVQQQGGEFTFLFFELQSPLFSGTPEEQIAEYNALPHTEAKCVAKIAMSAANTAVAIDNIMESFTNFNQQIQQAMKEQHNAENQ
jgi:hypothetical protein